MKLIDRSSELVAVDFTTLKAYTRYPYVLLLPQNITERELGKKLRELGVSVHRPKKVVRVSHGDDVEGTIGVTFESGEVIRARYVIGADGARSMVCQPFHFPCKH
jgi:2-polyprenyl-6-methoxyphenol hydroxylase-like FAD-dependent oxidoreductase